MKRYIDDLKDEHRHYVLRASHLTLVEVYMFVGCTIMLSLVIGLVWHPAWLLTGFGLVGYILARRRWFYHLTEEGSLEPVIARVPTVSGSKQTDNEKS